jgi:hypothetical protein
MMKYIAAFLLLVTAVLAQNASSKSPNLDIPAISRKANGSVVSIVVSDKDGHPLALGSGFFISKDGRVLTNYHVIKSGTSAVIKLPDGAFFVVDGVLASDKDRDVAIIKAHGNNLRPLTLGDSSRLQVGEEVVAIGSPLSLESTVSNGIISGIRTIEGEGGKFLQITTPISPGSSGGPLFDMAGEVVGITTSHIRGGENLNFAIPINDVKTLLAKEISTVRPLPDEAEDEGTTAGQSKPAPQSQDCEQKGDFAACPENEIVFQDGSSITAYPNLVLFSNGLSYVFNSQSVPERTARDAATSCLALPAEMYARFGKVADNWRMTSATAYWDCMMIQKLDYENTVRLADRHHDLFHLSNIPAYCDATARYLNDHFGQVRFGGYTLSEREETYKALRSQKQKWD